jgi:succinate dehydrogenase / fumarate reductase cytochrome b subunit
VAEHASAPAVSAREKYYFLLRRLHSLTGIVPIGFYLFFHLVINATIVAGPSNYQAAVDQIHLLKRLGLLLPVEMAFIFIPLAFHAILGLLILFGATPNASQYRYGPNVRYTLERVTAVVALFFILAHVWQMHWLGAPFGGAQFDPEAAPSTAAKALQSSALWAPVYAIGVICVVFHFANGLWTAAITWGLTIGRSAQRKFGYFCAALGIFLGVVGLMSIFGFTRLDADAASEAASSAHAQTAAVRYEPAD